MSKTLRLLAASLLALSAACQGQSAPASIHAPASATKNEADAGACAQLWRQVPGVAGAGLDTPARDLVNAWSAHEKQCRGTGIYEIHMALLLISDDDLDGAASEVASIKTTNPGLKLRARMLGLEIAMKRDVKQGKSPAQIGDAYSAEFDRLLDENPGNCFVKGNAGEFDLYLGKYQEAYTLTTAAAACEPNEWNWQMLAAIASERSGRAAESPRFCDRGAKLNRALFWEPKFLLACAIGFAEAGDQETAEAIMVILNERAPQTRGTEMYLRAAKAVGR